jgi:hypothetical protein
MITIGLVKELFYISVALHTDVKVELETDFNTPIILKIHKNVLDVTYKGYHIWNETVEGDTSFFGLESCDTISRIVAALNGNDWETAKNLMFFEDKLNSLDKKANLS